MEDKLFGISYRSALLDFRNARRQAALQEVWGRLTGKSSELLSFEEVSKRLRASASNRRVLKDIPLDSIVGSVGRYEDFNRDFLPKKLEIAARSYILRDWFNQWQSGPTQERIEPIEVDLKVLTEFIPRENGIDIEVSATGQEGVPLQLEFGIRKQGQSEQEKTMGEIAS